MIYVFGDSYSENPNIDGRSTYINDYFKYKGRKTKFYTQLLSEELKHEVKNFAKGGACNDYMFMEFMKNYKKIKPEDIVIFGWADILRILVPKNGIWISNTHGTDVLSKNSIEELFLMRSDPLFTERQLQIIDFIDNCLSSDITTIHWTWSTIPPENCLTIRYETNGEIMDGHYSEEGHHDLYQKILQQLSITNRVKINLWGQVHPSVVAGETIRSF